MNFIVTEDIIKEVEEMVLNNNYLGDVNNVCTTLDERLFTLPFYFKQKDVPKNLFIEDALIKNNIDYNKNEPKGILKKGRREHLLFEPHNSNVDKSISRLKANKKKKSKILKDLEKMDIPIFKSFRELPKHGVSVSKLKDRKLKHNNSLLGLAEINGYEPYYVYDERDSIERSKTPKGAKVYRSEADVPKNLKELSFFKKNGMRAPGIVSGVLKTKGSKTGKDLYNVNNATIINQEAYNIYKRGGVNDPYSINGKKISYTELLWNIHVKDCINCSREYIILDTETTGTNVDDQVVQLSIIALNGDVLFNSYFYTDKSMHKKAQEINNISDAVIKNAPKWTDKWGEIESLIRDKVIIAHNAKFDIERIISTCKRNNVDISFDFKYLCTMKHPNLQYMQSKKLINSITSLGMDFKESDLHEALFDCQGCLYIINPKHPIFAERKKAEKYYELLCNYNTGESAYTRRLKGQNWLKSNFGITESSFAVMDISTAQSVALKLEPYLIKKGIVKI